MNEKFSIIFVFVSTCLVLAASSGSREAMAQSLYRCGNVYQDQPCSTGETRKVAGVAASESAKNTSGSVDPSCNRLGAESLKIVWRREGGTTLEQALSVAQSASERRLVESVYRLRGTAPEVRARIENECAAETEKRERYSSLLEASNPVPAKPANAQAGLNPEVAQTQSGKTPVSRLKAEGKGPKADGTCDRLAQRLESIRSRQRAGGGISTMETLRTDHAEVEQEQRKTGCS